MEWWSAGKSYVSILHLLDVFADAKLRQFFLTYNLSLRFMFSLTAPLLTDLYWNGQPTAPALTIMSKFCYWSCRGEWNNRTVDSLPPHCSIRHSIA
jgi:hypothetical protein